MAGFFPARCPPKTNYPQNQLHIRSQYSVISWGSCSCIFKTSIHPSFSPGVLYSGAVLLTCRDETLSDGHRANPNRQFHSLLCVFSRLPSLAHSLTFPHTHTLAPTHSQTLSLFHSFISIHHDCHVNIKWVPPSSPCFSSEA